MVWMPRSARPAAMRSPMRLTNFTGVERWSGTGLMVAAESLRKRLGKGKSRRRFVEGKTERRGRARTGDSRFARCARNDNFF
jgi:hypothetical protein